MEWLFIPLGFAVGVFGTLIGIGGGIILIPILILTYPSFKPDTITAISLAMVFANSLSGSTAYAKMKRIKYKAGFVYAAAAIPGSILGALLIAYVNTSLFNIAFGVVMIIISGYIILRPKLELTSAALDGNFEPTPRAIKIGALYSTAVGLFSSMLGLGGGIIHVPLLIYLLKFPVHLATATSHFVLAIMTGSVTLVHIFDGSLTGQWLIVFFLIIGVIPGAQVGAFLSRKVHGVWIVRILGLVLALTGFRVLWMAR